MPLLSLPSYHAEVARTRDAVASQLAALWLGLPDYRDADVGMFVRVAVPKIQAGQIRTARLTAAHLGGPVLSRELIVQSRKVSQHVEYRRPANSLYTALAQGQTFTDALTAGMQRLESLVVTDLQLALVTQSQHSLKANKASHYRRVLTGSENCPLCRIASTNVYSTGDLLPIHDHCDCTVEPIYDPADYTPPEIDPADLVLSGLREKDVQQGASAQSLVTVHEHGELGSVLGWRTDHFTGPSDVPIVLDGVHK